MTKLTDRKLQRCSLSSEAGQALAELALTMSFLLLPLFLGAVEFARVSYVAIEVANAAKAAAQYGGQNSTTAADTTGMQTAAINDAGNLTLTDNNVNVNVASGVITVKVSYPFNPLIHLPGLPTTFTLHGQAIQQVM
jgi:Flp pilus assembly protein TadG